MHQVDGGSKIQEPAQEFMVAMECLFYEWYEDLGLEEGQLFGRRAASNNTMALEIVTKEGGVNCTCFCCPMLACTMAIFMAWQLRVRNRLSNSLEQLKFHGNSTRDMLPSAEAIGSYIGQSFT